MAGVISVSLTQICPRLSVPLSSSVNSERLLFLGHIVLFLSHGTNTVAPLDNHPASKHLVPVLYYTVVTDILPVLQPQLLSVSFQSYFLKEDRLLVVVSFWRNKGEVSAHT